ncbi:MAG: 16S rRNA (cytosine(1402)-N(4))-methyltransferase RsmH [Desulfobulbaceae bacterium]|jgi:16S rRNA (cytosine1402-N4)-methyltransferase|nr:16S rRNA (cytosine(1402)-N(4))-methyltransferase RsmH [Desulfobulbaceae bacterium]
MGGHEGEAHTPVLEDEVIAYLRPVSGGRYVDATLGLGGHAKRILEASAPHGILVGLEWDNQAIEPARRRLAPFGNRVRIIRATYTELAAVLRREGMMEIDGLLLDLGVSSLQLDRPERGFSFREDAPLDMRMDRRLPETAADMIARLSQEELADIFYNYGEERQARRIAARLVQARESGPIETTGQLAALVGAAIPKKYHPPGKHVATRVFQALRIAVNRELDNLVKVLAEAPVVLAPGGRIGVITFHSIEDRIVKHALAGNPAYRVVTRKPVEPSREEIARNPRARSAKLRVAEKVA